MKRSKPNPKRRKAVTEFLESANIVDCPRYVQRTIRLNLHEAAACNINLQLQKRAQELLTATEAQSEPAAPAAAQKPTTMTAQTNAVVQTNKAATGPAASTAIGNHRRRKLHQSCTRFRKTESTFMVRFAVASHPEGSVRAHGDDEVSVVAMD